MASEGRRYVKPSQVAKELMNPSLLSKWRQFADEIGVPSTDIEVKREEYSRGNIPAAELFTDLLGLRCANEEFPISVILNALEEMELLGIAGDLKESFPENPYISNNPKRFKKTEEENGTNQRTPVGGNCYGGTPMPSVEPATIERKFVRPLDVAEILNSCGPLLVEWRSFGQRLGLPSTQLKPFERRLNQNDLTYEQLFNEILEAKCAMGELPLSVVCKALGKWKSPIETLEKKYPGDHWYVSEETG